MAFFSFQSFADSSHGGIVEQEEQYMQRCLDLAESAVLSGSSRLYSSVNCGSRN